MSNNIETCKKKVSITVLPLLFHKNLVQKCQKQNIKNC